MSDPNSLEWRQAENKLRKALREHPREPRLLYDYARLLSSGGHAAKAEAAARQLAEVAPHVAEAQFIHGLTLRDLGRRAEAEVALSRAVEMEPSVGTGWLARATTRMELGKLEEAVKDFERAERLFPDPFDAVALKSNALAQLARHAEALATMDRALALRSDAVGVWRARAMLLADMGRREESDRSIDQGLAINPSDVDAWVAKGELSVRANRHVAAIDAFERALALAPERKEIEELLIVTRKSDCDWRHFDADQRRMQTFARDPSYPVRPFSLLGFDTSPADHLFAARKYVAAFAPPLPAQPFATPASGQRIRVAYLSSDFRAHAAAYLNLGVIEHHDRQKFEVAAFSVGPDDRSEIRGRVAAAFDDFVDASKWSDEKLAAEIRERGVDLLVDLNGLTKEARLGALARRPAPVQVSFEGYPSTTGAPYIDYLIADRWVISEAERADFSEQVVYVPDSCLPADNRRRIAERVPSRAELGLPEHGFIFSSFNAAFKLTPAVFRLWMRILAATPGSTLWLREENAALVANLRTEAEACGVAPERCVFAPFVDRDEDYLARLGCADLMLDCHPYSARTTAIDSLWAGTPVLTRPGSTFAGRVAGSVLRAAGLPELIVESDEAYFATAVALAQDPQRLAALRGKIAGEVKTSALFDTERFTRNLERAFEAMHARRLAGKAPAAIDLA